MAGINNLGNNLKLQNLQLTKTAEVDTQKAEGQEVGDAKKAAVWISNNPGDVYDDDSNYSIGWGPHIRPGDVMFVRGVALRLCVNPEGEQYWAKTTVLESDFEADRGDVRRN